MIKTYQIAATFAAVLFAGAAHAGSNVIGSVETDVTIRRAYQNQSGLLNKQELNAGSVRGSRVIGSIETDVRLDSVRQSQSGL